MLKTKNSTILTPCLPALQAAIKPGLRLITRPRLLGPPPGLIMPALRTFSISNRQSLNRTINHRNSIKRLVSHLLFQLKLRPFLQSNLLAAFIAHKNYRIILLHRCHKTAALLTQFHKTIHSDKINITFWKTNNLCAIRTNKYINVSIRRRYQQVNLYERSPPILPRSISVSISFGSPKRGTL